MPAERVVFVEKNIDRFPTYVSYCLRSDNLKRKYLLSLSVL